jgi:uncharacterized protein YjbI with pentapeptide repeats
MASAEHLKILSQGVGAWNTWHRDNRVVTPDLSDTDLSGADLVGVDLVGAYLTGANLTDANLTDADLSGASLAGAYLARARLADAKLTHAKLSRADLTDAYFLRADLSGADLVYAKVIRADFTDADLTNADLSRANLAGARLVRTNFEQADLGGCRVYGVSAWSVTLTGANQSNLGITDWGEPTITLDNLEVAQFIYLLLHNEKIRDVINTITSKAVLILGRFSPERKAVLDVVRDELRRQNYLPILFDFDKPASLDLTETVSTLARLARFVIADLTEARSVAQELMSFVPDVSVPVQPVIHASDREWAMFPNLGKYPWMLPTYTYDTLDGLLGALQECVIAPAEWKARKREIEAGRPEVVGGA